MRIKQAKDPFFSLGPFTTLRFLRRLVLCLSLRRIQFRGGCAGRGELRCVHVKAIRESNETVRIHSVCMLEVFYAGWDKFSFGDEFLAEDGRFLSGLFFLIMQLL